MFDNLRCEYPLPDGFEGDASYQTKDTPDQCLNDYTITADGTLVQQLYRSEPVPEDEKPDAEVGSLREILGRSRRVADGTTEALDFHGAIEFYSCGPDSAEREYVALFDHGKLLKIETIASS